MAQDCKKFTLRLYDDKDQDLLDWLNSQRPGEQGEVIKKLLRVALGMNIGEKHIPESIQSGAPINAEILVEELNKCKRSGGGGFDTQKNATLRHGYASQCIAQPPFDTVG